MQAVNQFLRRVPPWAVYVGGVLPFLWIVWLTLNGGLGADPVKEIELRLGLLSLQFLVAGLCVTPLRWLGLNLIRYRRAIGLMAFFYVTMHLLTWGVLDMGLRLDQIAADLVKRWYIIIGLAGFLMLVPLAVTSNNLSIRRLGPKAWQRLHRLTYGAILAGAVHYVMIGKVWLAEPLLYLAAAAALLALRVWKARPRAVAVA
ncbi:MAG: sulfoxide reductase heme-binding subunit YedZ [Rhodobacteraceae bacterium PARR1]|nr:MAG: sulfoxide reductase heme-binding subunit YedZ [Rhodobacteraceae bacterium PARR1]